ncbi:holin-like protein [Oxalobacteraceae bacterium GrIS 2.11]
MLLTFAVLLLFQCLGEAVVFVVKLPIPGPVAGMLLLLAVLLVWPKLMNRLEATANELLRHLALLFVPAGVGIIVSAGSLQGHWLAVICSVLISTVLTLIVTASVMRYLMARNSVQPGNNDAQ